LKLLKDGGCDRWGNKAFTKSLSNFNWSLLYCVRKGFVFFSLVIVEDGP